MGKLCVPLAMLAVFLGTAPAGEENLMAMRGNAPDGYPGMTRFRFERGEAGSYVGWRDCRARVPRLVAGQASLS